MTINLLPDVPKSKGYQPDNWTPKHRMVVALHMQGFTHAEISEMTGFSESNMGKIINDPRAEHDMSNELAPIADIGASVAVMFEERSARAVEVMTEIMEDAIKDEVRLKAATAILDRAGHGPIKREIKFTAEIPIDKEAAESMRQTLKETAGLSVVYDKDGIDGEILDSQVLSPTEEIVIP